jgi:hypothetical protein
MGRIPSGRPPNQPLLLISSRHREVMRRLVAGETQHQIAMDMGFTESRLSVICNSPLFKRQLAELNDEVHERYVERTGDIQGRLLELQPKAVDVLESIISKKEVDGKVVSLNLKKETALDILELAGSGKKKNNTVADAMGDVVKVISDGFKLAKELRDQSMRDAAEEQHRLSGQERGLGIIDNYEYGDKNNNINKRDVNVRVVGCSADSGVYTNETQTHVLDNVITVDANSLNSTTNNKQSTVKDKSVLGDARDNLNKSADQPTVPLPLLTQYIITDSSENQNQNQNQNQSSSSFPVFNSNSNSRFSDDDINDENENENQVRSA